MLALFPEGFEEAERGDEFELSAYTDAGGEARMSAVFGAVAAKDVPADWEERWKHFHRPVRAGRIWIVPPWEQSPQDEDSITIDPGRAFGTGSHPTTRLCLELLSELEPGRALNTTDRADIARHELRRLLARPGDDGDVGRHPGKCIAGKIGAAARYVHAPVRSRGS